MVASPAEAGPFGGTILCDDRLTGPASHDGTGRRFVFCPAPGDHRAYALDIELRTAPPPEAIAGLLGPDAMQRWGEIEVMAKLLDIPAHLVLRRVLAGKGPDLIRAHQIVFCRADTDDLWRVVGRRAA
jgi:hypothetical protein